MKRYISRKFIKNLVSRTDINNFIGQYIKLKKKNKYYYSLCPFHTENTPSFIVNNDKQFYYCFGCNEHGNVIDFLMKYNGLDFLKSIKELALFNGYKDIPIKKNKIIYKYNFKNLYKLINNVNKFYKKNLYKKHNFIAYNYLKNRKLDKNIIDFFEIGFSSNGNNITNFFTKNKNNNLEYLKILGLIKKHNNKKFIDFFRNRIIFPIKNINGQIVGFGGRTVNNTFPKYINTSDNFIFSKKNNLYGLYEMYKLCKNFKNIILVEGYIDVLTLFQFGFYNTISTLGNNINKIQIKMLFNNSKHIICCYDGDQSGLNAAWNMLKLSLSYMKEGYQLKFVFLPKGEDPDSFIKKYGVICFKKILKKSESLSVFFFKMLMLKINYNSIENLINLSLLAIPLIKKIPNRILRLNLREKLGKILNIPEDILESLISKKFIYNKKKINIIKCNNIKTLISLLIQNPVLFKIIPNNMLHIFNKSKKFEISLFLNLVCLYKKNNKITTGQLIELYRNTKYEKIIKSLLILDNMISIKLIKKIFIDIFYNLCKSEIEIKINKLILKEKFHKSKKKYRILLYYFIKKLSEINILKC
ncbi:DNA primase [Candidatus Annandia adelgestsuga]|uniref:DNA primase n=1 Tax=Candidatus Annandia adelgestsuga TaxID=1302411 RepID=A0A3Q9CKM9_9ENTR|nr:DNA primase [Candidatus Annandia adelgestsuga]AZP36180.1 DNA primase [Candidatus Annandia adelgestsuga]